MQDRWYSDARDIIKWTAVVHLAAQHSIRSVIYVAMLRASGRPTLATSSGRVRVPDCVWEHFRNLSSVRRLGRAAGFNVIVHDTPFSSKSRAAYFVGVMDKLKRVSGAKAVLLDPDTGFEPALANAKHVTANNVRSTWNALGEGDWLLLYQHQWRNAQWKRIAAKRFAASCPGSRLKWYQAAAKPKDVILLAARKGVLSA